MVADALELPPDVISCWTDSNIALCWIQGDPNRWKQFVRNRVVKIHSSTEPSMWNHCPGVDNPADLVSRGVHADELVNSDLWKYGPPFLSQSVEAGHTLAAAASSVNPILLQFEIEAVRNEARSSTYPLMQFSVGEQSTASVDPVINGTVLAESDVGKQTNVDTVLLLGDVDVLDDAGVEASFNDTVMQEAVGACKTIENPNLPTLDVKRWRSLPKAIGVVAWCLRFVNNLKSAAEKRIRDKSLSIDECTLAKEVLIKEEQKFHFGTDIRDLKTKGKLSNTSKLRKFNPFLDADGFLKVKSRLQFSKNLTAGEKFPILLPKSHLSKLLIQSQHIIMKHADVSMMLTAIRCHYWIIGVRKLAKSVKDTCFRCKVMDAKPGEQVVAPLPATRVTPSAPFSIVGIDHTGVLYCSDHPGKKFHVLLCTCAVVRAIHLELVDSLGAPDTFLGMRRMHSRRGIGTCVYLDNAKAFKALPKLMQQHYGHLSPKFVPIAPRAPWWGGWWERLNRNVKSALKRSIGLRSLTRSELETTLHEIEGCVNSRPLTFVSDVASDPSPLTPAHFLIGRACPFVPPSSGVFESQEQVKREHLESLKDEREELLSHFWQIWTDEYIKSLPPGRAVGSPSDIKVGSVVLMREDNTPRLSWPIGVVQEMYPGRDGVCRTVSVKTKRGVFVRPIQRIHDLEICDTVDERSVPSGVETVKGASAAAEATRDDTMPGRGAARFFRAAARCCASRWCCARCRARRGAGRRCCA